MFVIFVKQSTKQPRRPLTQTQRTKTIAQTPNIDVFHEPPNLNLSGSPFFQKTSVKKNQNRFHQSNPDHNPDLGPYKPYT